CQARLGTFARRPAPRARGRTFSPHLRALVWETSPPDSLLAQNDVDHVLLDGCSDQLHDQLASPHAAELCFKREAPDHVLRERYFSSSLLALVMHRDREIRRCGTLSSALLTAVGQFPFFHAPVLCQWLILYIRDVLRDRR